MSSQEKKKKNKLLLLSLPDDLLLSCFGRISRLYYPTLSLVSKRFRSLLASPELYKVRSLLGRTENCLYVCLKFAHEDFRWFTLCRKPDHHTQSSGYALAAVPIPHSPPSHSSSLVAVGSNIYNIYGSSSLSILDCQSHTWLEAPTLPVKLSPISASLVDQKIYVVGKHDDSDSYSDSNFGNKLVMVFDIKTHIWDPIPIHCSEALGDLAFSSACIDGKFHMKTSKGVLAYNSKERRWDLVEGKMKEHMLFDCSVIANVLYSYDNGAFRWYDSDKRQWKELKGLVGRLPAFAPRGHASVKLADYGGKMMVLWTKNLRVDEKMIIWCAEISLEKRNNGCGMWGKVEWFDHVLITYSKSGRFPVVVNGLTVTV